MADILTRDFPLYAHHGRRSFHAVLKAWWQNYRTRRTLRTLDDEALLDIGLTRAEAEQEASVPFWR